MKGVSKTLQAFSDRLSVGLAAHGTEFSEINKG